MQCPKCKADNVRPAKEKRLDFIAALVRKSAWRCRGCGARFYAALHRMPARTQKRSLAKLFKNPSPRAKKWAQEAAILFVALLLFFVFVKYLATEHGSSI